eukprot:870766-Karenia_brevis.AAC.1
MVAVVQQLPNRKRPRADGLDVIKPSAQQVLEAKGHQIETRGQRLHCMMCGQEWRKGKVLEGDTCPGPQ